MADTEMQLLAAQIKALSLADRLRLAAGLLDADRADVAQRIAHDVALELGATFAIAKFAQLDKKSEGNG